jgi:probable HAF family extracellular repeat protein
VKPQPGESKGREEMYTATLRRSRCLKVVLVALAALLVALVGTEPRQAEAVDAPHYTITDLGAIPDNTDSEATAINTSGQVVGRLSNGPAPSPMAFLYENGVMTKLGLLPGASGSEAYGINDNAQIVGSADVGGAKPCGLSLRERYDDQPGYAAQLRYIWRQ